MKRKNDVIQNNELSNKKKRNIISKEQELNFINVEEEFNIKNIDDYDEFDIKNIEEDEQINMTNSEEEEEEEEETKKTSTKKDYMYYRRTTPYLNNTKKMIFQNMDIDYELRYTQKFSSFKYPGRQSGRVPVIRIYGVTKEKYSVFCRVWGFTPYFYVEMPKNNKISTVTFQCNLMQWYNEDYTSCYRNMPVIYKMEMVKKQSIYHYQFNKKKSFIKIYTGSPEFVPKLRKVLEKKKYMTYESNVLFTLRCMIDSNIRSSAWIELPPHTYNVSSLNDTFCNIEIDTCYKSIITRKSVGIYENVAPLRILSFDIECMGYQQNNKGKVHFPIVNKKECQVIQIANVITVQGESQPLLKNIFLLNTCSPIQDCRIYSYQDERQLLLAWTDFVQTVDPDIITGYNIINFDIPYLLDRAKFLTIQNFSILGRLRRINIDYKTKNFSSAQRGTFETKVIKLNGRIILDPLNVIKIKFRLSSYTLNNVCSEFLGEQKEDVHYTLMPSLQRGSSKDRNRLATYCLKDAILPQRLLDKLMIVINQVEMSRVTGIPISVILSRGEQIKVMGQLLRETSTRDIVIPTFPYDESKNIDLNKKKVEKKFKLEKGQQLLSFFTNKEKNKVLTKKKKDKGFEGATVLKPMKGYYDKIPTSTLDFSSLYPSIMIANNLCYTTLVPKNRVCEFKKKDILRTPTGDVFVRDHIQKGLLPEILKNLLSARKGAKKDRKREKKGSIKYAVLDGRQLALKISANSVYGFTGAIRGMLTCIPISRSVTSIGRGMINDTKNWVEKNCPGAVVIYGDSVVGDTPILLRYNGKIRIEQIQNIARSKLWQRYSIFNDKKEQVVIPNIDVWSYYGWLPIKRLIRHKTKKKIYRINTHCGCVDVTEDHSLLTKNQKQIKPNKCVIGKTLLLHSLPPPMRRASLVVEGVNMKKLGLKLAWVYGLFFSSGTTHVEGNNSYWEISNKNTNLLKKAHKYLSDIYKHTIYDFVIHNRPCGEHPLPGRLTINKWYGKIKEFCQTYRVSFYDGKLKKVPVEILNDNNKLILQSFLDGYYEGGGEKVGTGKRFYCKGKIGSMGLYFICYKLGYNISINCRKDKLDIYRMTFSKNKFRKNPYVIKKIIQIKNVGDYVYDIETIVPESIKKKNPNSSQFHAGVGGLIVKNTDSVMVQFSHQDIYHTNLKKFYKKCIEELTKEKEDQWKIDSYKKKLKKEFFNYTLNEYLDNKKELKALVIKNFQEEELDSLLIEKKINRFLNDKEQYTLLIKKKINELKVKVSIEMGIYVGLKITKALFREPNNLVFEKVYFPYLLSSKKHYIGLYFTKAEKPDKIDSKGIELVRRDAVPLVRETLKMAFHILFIELNKQKMIRYIKQVSTELFNNNIDIALLVMSKTYNPPYKNQQPHSTLTDKVKKRSPGMEAKSGDRVKYIIINNGKAKNYDKSEDPIYALKHNLIIDIDHYWGKLKKTIERLLGPVLTKKEMNNILYGKHTRVKKKVEGRGQLTKHLKKRKICLHCSVPILNVHQKNPLCIKCQSNEVFIYKKVLDQKNNLESLYYKIINNCLMCQNSVMKKIVCTNDDCPFFYVKYQLQVKLKNIQSKASLFDW
jgi:DNA polymerase delta subunit 1